MPPPSVAVSNCRGLFRFLLISHVSCLRLKKLGGTWKWHPYFIVFFAHVPSCNSKTWGQVLVGCFFDKTSAHFGGYIEWLALISMSLPLSNDIMYLLWLIRARIISWNAQGFARWAPFSSQNYFWGEPWDIMGHTRQNSKCFFSIPSLRRSACNSRLASDFRLPPHLSSAVSLRGKCWTNTELDTFVWSKWVVAEKSHNVSFILYDYSIWLYLTI